MDLSVVPLHKHPEYLMDCCRLINQEWRRSDTARLRGLECSCDRLPTCLILLQNEQLIGHLKLSIIPSIREACFVESVVIDKKLRGKGYGSNLMRQAEAYCKDRLNLQTIYLSTKGQEQFYSKLGYTECPPISIYGKPNTIAPQRILKDSPRNPVGSNAPLPPPLPSNITTTSSVKTFMKKELQV